MVKSTGDKLLDQSVQYAGLSGPSLSAYALTFTTLRVTDYKQIFFLFFLENRLRHFM